MKKKKFIVSAVVPVYNSSSYIKETIYSLLNQKRKFDEIIIVDDGSIDNTLEVLNKIKGIKIIESKHAERSAARNTGWKSSKGDIIAFIESDSFFDKDWLAEVLKAFEDNHEAVIDRRSLYKPKTFIAKMNDNFYDLRYKNYKPFNAWVMTKDLLKDVGGFDENLMGPEDIDLGRRIIKKGYRIFFAKNAIQYHKGEPKTIKEGIKRSFFYGSRIIPYWKKTKSIPYLKFISFTILIISIMVDLAMFIGLSLTYLLYVFLRDLKRGMKMKYLAAHPFYMLITESSFIIGAWYGLLVGSMKKLR